MAEPKVNPFAHWNDNAPEPSQENPFAHWNNQPSAPSTPEDSAEVPDGSLIKDLWNSWGIGSNNFLKSIGTVYGLATGDMDNYAVQQGQRGVDHYSGKKSEELKSKEEKRTAAIEAADSEWGKAGAYLWATATDPGLLLNLIAEQAPLSIPGGAAGRGVQALGAGAKVGTGVAVGTGMALNAADVSSDAYDGLLELPDELWEENKEYNDRVSDGEDPTEVKEKIALRYARGAAAGASLITLGTQFIPGARAIEKKLASGNSGLTGTIGKNVLKGVIGEGAQEIAEEGGGKLISNAIVGQIDPNQSLTEGVGEQSAAGFLGGGVMGGVAGIGKGPSDSTVDDDVAEVVADLGPTTNVDEMAAAAETSINDSEDPFNEDESDIPDEMPVYNPVTDDLENVPVSPFSTEPVSELGTFTDDGVEFQEPGQEEKDPPLSTEGQKIADQHDPEIDYTPEQQEEIDEVDGRLESAQATATEAADALAAREDNDSDADEFDDLEFESENAQQELADIQAERDEIATRIAIETETGTTEAEAAVEIDKQANEAATSTENDLTAPTEAQQEAGNTKLGHLKVSGFDISVENPRGSDREGKSEDGKAWKTTMTDHYGYIKRTKGADEEQIDVFVGKKIFSDKVFIVDQSDQKGGFDEHKVMMGYGSMAEAVEAYKSNYDKDWEVGTVSELTKAEFKDWLNTGDNKVAYAAGVAKNLIDAAAKQGLEPPEEETSNSFGNMSAATKFIVENPMAPELRDLDIDDSEFGDAFFLKDGKRLTDEEFQALLPEPYDRTPIRDREANEAEAKAAIEKEDKALAAAAEEEAKAGPKVIVNTIGADGLSETERASATTNSFNTPAELFGFANKNKDAALTARFDFKEEDGSWHFFSKDGARLTDAELREEVSQDPAIVAKNLAAAEALEAEQEIENEKAAKRKASRRKSLIKKRRNSITLRSETAWAWNKSKAETHLKDWGLEGTHYVYRQGNEYILRQLPDLTEVADEWHWWSTVTSNTADGSTTYIAVPEGYHSKVKSWVNGSVSQKAQKEVIDNASDMTGSKQIETGDSIIKIPSLEAFRERMELAVTPTGKRLEEMGKEYPEIYEGSEDAAMNEKLEEPTVADEPSFGDDNKVFTKDAMEEALQELKDSLNTLNSGIDPKLVLAGIKVAGFYVEGGTRKFAQFADAMIDAVGVQIKPYLKMLYNMVRDYPGFNNKGMSSAEEMDKYFSDQNTQSRPSVKDGPPSKWNYVEAVVEVSLYTPEVTAAAQSGRFEKGVYWDTLEVALKNAIEMGIEDSTGVDKQFYKALLPDGIPAPQTFDHTFYRDSYTKTLEAANNNSEEDQDGTVDRTGEGTLDGVSTEEGGGSGGSGSVSTGQGSVPGSGTDGGRDGLTDGGGASTQYGMGDGEGGIPASETGAGSDSDVRGGGLAGHTPTIDFTITEDFDLGAGGMKTKFKNNIAAIKLLKELEEKGMQATPDQQAVLAKYVGWGGLKQAFPRHGGSTAKGWESEAAELRGILNDEEYAAARRSTLDAHYTSEEIIRGIYSALERLGFKNGSILEPSVGAGNFFGLMPKGMRSASTLNAVELDNITGGIAKQLYPSANISSPMGFEKFYMANGSFDVAIGNPPFGDQPIYDASRKDISKMSIHNYFFGKSIDGLRENGILAMVVSSSLMDKAGTKERKYFASKTELLGAIRLPNNAFSENANTEVTTDIIFLRKLAEGETATGEDWATTSKHIGGDNTVFDINSYFAANPHMMLGEMRAEGTMYRPDSPALIAREGQNTGEELEKAIKNLPENIYTTGKTFVAPEIKSEALNDDRSSYIKPMGLYYVGDQLKKRLPDNGSGETTFSDVNTRTQSSGKAVDYSKAQKSRIKGMVDIGIDLSKLLESQLSLEATDKTLNSQRKKLNTSYDSFVKKHGLINSTTNRSLMQADPMWPRLAALEIDYDKGLSALVAKNSGQKPRRASAKKSDIFSKRTQTPYRPVLKVASAKEGLMVSLSEMGVLDIPHIAKISGQSEESVISELGDLVYSDPVDGWQTSDQYLSGNVKLKLQQAIDAANGDEQYSRNVTALEKVIPKDIDTVDISVKIGAPWISPQVMSDFVDHLAGKPVSATFNYSKPLAAWSISGHRSSARLSTMWGAYDNAGNPTMDGVKLIKLAANGKIPKIYRDVPDGNGGTTRAVDKPSTDAAIQKTNEIKEEFEEWLWKDADRRESLSKVYNDTYNTTVNRSYDGSHLVLPGKVSDDVIELFPHQKNFIWRVMQGKTTLADHVVGAGKTFAMVGAAMELKRTGLANKPMLVVPNHLIQQWSNDFLALYPNANILAPTKADFQKKNRKELIARIATGDWDAVIIAHSSFKKLPSDANEERNFIEDQIEELSASIEDLRAASGQDPRTVRDAERAKARLESKLQELLNQEGKDTDNFNFSELGVDAIFVDEAHEFKNLSYQTSNSRLPGLGDPSGSQKAQDLFVKTQSVLRKTKGKNVVFATGTPISNSMVELYTMQRYLGHKELKSKGLAHADAWISVFGEVVSDTEIDATGQNYKMNSRLAKFVNMGELVQMYKEFADSITRDDINEFLKSKGQVLKVPKIKGGKPELAIVPRSDSQSLYMEDIVHRAENLPSDPSEDNMLKITSDARKSALDMRLIDPTAEHDPEGKIATAVSNIKKIADRWEHDKGAQLVFLDLSTPKGSATKERAIHADLVAKADQGDEAAQAALAKYTPDDLSALEGQFSAYDEMKARLISAGFQESEVAFIHDANTDDRKTAMFAKVRSGDIRVLLGSTAKMGAGMNVQERLVALHHMDAPWRPSDIEQREGRIIRQGNSLYDKYDGFEVEILRYATERTYDSRMWQTLEKKARFIEQMRAGDVDTREIDDISGAAANAAEMKAVSSGNPLIMEEFELRSEINKLQGMKKSFNRKQYALADEMKKKQLRIDSLPQIIIDSKADAETFAANPFEEVTKDNPTGFSIEVDGQKYAKREDAGKLLVSRMAKFMRSGAPEVRGVGSYRGFSIDYHRYGPNSLDVYLSGERDYWVNLYVTDNEISGSGLITRIQNTLAKIPDEESSLSKELKEAKVDIAEMQESVGGEFAQEEELAKLKKRQKEVVAELTPDDDALVVFDTHEEALAAAVELNVDMDGNPEEVTYPDPEDREAVVAAKGGHFYPYKDGDEYKIIAPGGFFWTKGSDKAVRALQRKRGATLSTRAGRPLSDINISEQFEVEGTGELVRVSTTAEKLVEDVDGRIDELKKLISCLKAG